MHRCRKERRLSAERTTFSDALFAIELSLMGTLQNFHDAQMKVVTLSLRATCAPLKFSNFESSIAPNVANNYFYFFFNRFVILSCRTSSSQLSNKTTNFVLFLTTSGYREISVEHYFLFSFSCEIRGAEFSKVVAVH